MSELTQEQKRIALLELVMKDNTKIKVCEVATLFGGVIDSLEKNTQTWKNAKAKFTEDEWVAFLCGLINSFTSSLYMSAPKNIKELERRMKIVEEANKDLKHGVSIRIEKDAK